MHSIRIEDIWGEDVQWVEKVRWASLTAVSNETVPTHLLQRLLRVVERRGYEIGPLLRSAGIREDVAYDARARVTLDQLSDMTRALWAVTGDELFGVGPAVPIGSFRLVARSMLTAPDLRTMLIRMDQASRVLTTLPRLEAVLDGPTPGLTVDVSQLEDPEHLVIDTLVAFIHRTIGWAIGRRVPLALLDMPYEAPPYLRYYEATFGRLPAFGADVAALGFETPLLDAPLLRTNADVDAYLKNSPKNYFATRDYGSTTADQTRRVLEQGLTGEWPTSDEIASRLSVSVHHLRRLLREEGTSVTTLREDLRRDTAINSLVAGNESVEDLGARLGFSEASAFRRAFRRWTGMPPGAYRRHTGED